jgi:hypothetical protein
VVADDEIIAYHEENSSEAESVESPRNSWGNKNAKRHRTASEERVWFIQEHKLFTPKKANLHSKNGCKWSFLPQSIGKTPARNLVLHMSGLKDIYAEIENLYLFFSHEIIRLIVLHMIEEIAHQRESYASIQSYAGDTCEEEIQAFVGLYYVNAA